MEISEKPDFAWFLGGWMAQKSRGSQFLMLGIEKAASWPRTIRLYLSF
jgi:hypothetical protein